ncbi:hypothetical protein G7069_09085 [Lysobacter sp. HDW10]|jgi:hypothetical protein|uniref:hypothetical protein n=1 Tax=Lysobacter sp. HDW10 TaxID=2714936 RepID=UPI001409427C|nr:hypothetical protein [Lysobacter sp. HDW10]QIK81733.1 hypothetical protein G7069_09085 [Lysobacter sp. HDW10]
MKTVLKLTVACLVLAGSTSAFAQAKKEAPVTKDVAPAPARPATVAPPAAPAAAKPIAMPKGAAEQAAYKQRMVAAVATVMPVGKIMMDVAANDPYWPSSKARKPDATKLACMRTNLKEDGYRKVLATRVDTYASTHADRFGSDLTLMEGEGAKLFSKIMMAGARSATNGENTEMTSLLKDASPRAMLDLMSLANDPANSPLRALMGMEAAIGTDEKNGKEIGENAGMTMMLPMLVNAMEVCKVKMDEL